MIINLRGTSGSGKTTVVRNIMRRWPHAPVEFTKTARGQKPLVYRIIPSIERRLFVFGSYATECGGCDTISDYKTIIPELLPRYAPLGDILYEGMLISGTYGSIGPVLAAMETAGHGPAIFAFLDTPIEVCLERVRARRVARGDLRELDPSNTVSKYKAILNAKKRVSAPPLSHRVVDIDHRDAEAQVLALLGLPNIALKAAATAEEPKKLEQVDLFS